MSLRFSCVNPGVCELPLSCFASEVDLVGAECLFMIKTMVFVFVLLEVDVTLGGGCRI